MEEKRRSKRAKPLDEGSWDCSVCTYKNPSEAFKCEMCDVRKGTSTRKPRLNQQLVAQQAAQQFPPPPPKKERSEKGHKEKADKDNEDKEQPIEDGTRIKERKDKTTPTTSHTKRKSSRPPRLRNIDRSSGTSMAVTVDNVTVIITDFKPKKRESNTHSAAVSPVSDKALESPVATSSGPQADQNSSTQSSPEGKSPVAAPVPSSMDTSPSNPVKNDTTPEEEKDS